ncbi:alpha/beta hydrolase family protein [Alicyclobacillus sp.]|uniref:alpha/beta hydrolase family protein n=1 Tax=Alicyclobacillus sp. TaxID=61169 RepID=UPI0025C067E1|nr:alpha/beta hydrolase family protein [Alicyclobacillus sp.]MCL6515495.1 alpha/beta hydrolase family protein [Alicyclobacillus sp.]
MITRPEDILTQVFQDGERNRAAHWNTETDPLVWRRRLADLLGMPAERGWSRTPPASPEPVLIHAEVWDGLRFEWVTYTTIDNIRTLACVLTQPEAQGRRPAVLACPGHGRGLADAIGRMPPAEVTRHLNEAESIHPGTPRSPASPARHAVKPSTTTDPIPPDGGIYRRFAVELARRGFVVLVPEMLGFGVRRLAEDAMTADDRRASCYRIATHLLMHGRTLAGFRTHETLCALDHLETRADVDARRIGIFGFSGGGLIALLTAALDERIRAIVLSGCATTSPGSILAAPHCVDNYIPGLLRWGDLPDWMGLLAPRPLFLEIGDRDPVFPPAAALEAAARVHRRYEAMGMADAMEIDRFPGGHEICGRRSFDWLARQLDV